MQHSVCKCSRIVIKGVVFDHVMRGSAVEGRVHKSWVEGHGQHIMNYCPPSQKGDQKSFETTAPYPL